MVGTLERKTLPVTLGVPLGWPQRSGSQAPEADALSTELKARGPESYPLSVARPSASGFTLSVSASIPLGLS